MTDDDVESLSVDPANVEQLRSWDGDTGAYWAEHARRYDDGVAAYHDGFLTAAALEEAGAVLDIGCGSGQTTRDAARRVSGAALGVDLSSRMIALARRLAEDEGVPNVAFEQADAQVHAFRGGSVDVAISRTGSMFFGDPLAAFANIGRALRLGGRLVLLTWQPFERNEWIRSFFSVLAAGRDLPTPASASPGPFSLSDPDLVRGLLTSAGFADVRTRALSEPMRFGADPDDAARFVAGQFAWLLRGLDPETTARALDALRADAADHVTDRGVEYGSATWLIEAVRPTTS